jgi:hypothetical protein
LESLIDLQTHVSSFRELFKSQQTTNAFISAFRSFIKLLASAELRPILISLLDKLKHFGLTLALDEAVSGGQKREVEIYVCYHVALKLIVW